MTSTTIGTAGNASPLLQEHAALGAMFTDFAGWQMPLKYGSEISEHHAVRKAVGLFDLSHMGEIELTGTGAAAALDHALVGELSKIGIGVAKYSLMCDADGGIVDDLVVYRLADERFLVVANAANAPAVYREFIRRSAGFEVQVTDRSAHTALIAVQGPAARDVITSLTADDQVQSVIDLKYYASVPTVVAGIRVLLARTGYTGEDGFELYVPNEHAVPLWQALLDATRGHDGLPAGLACRDTLRLEAGMALYGHELSLDTNPYEAGLGRVVRLNKDFVGRDALQAVSERSVTRTLVGLRGDGRRAARAGYPVYAASGDIMIGTVTSGALSPTLGYPIALAYVDAAVRESGTELTVDIRGKHEPFLVTPYPFYKRS